MNIHFSSAKDHCVMKGFVQRKWTGLIRAALLSILKPLHTLLVKASKLSYERRNVVCTSALFLMLMVFDPLTPCSFTCLLEFRVLRFFDEGRVASAAMKGRVDGRMCQRPKLVTIFSNLHMTFKELIFEEQHFCFCPFQMNFCGPSAKVVNVIMTLRKGTQVSGAKVPF